MKAIIEGIAAGFAVAAVVCGALYAEADDYWITTQGSVTEPMAWVGQCGERGIGSGPEYCGDPRDPDYGDRMKYEERLRCMGKDAACITGGKPGDVDRARICARGAAAAGRPPAAEWKRMKNAALDRAGIPRKRSGEYEYDHIIPRCLGGSNDPDNLQLQTWDVARVKDDLERFVCRQYCDGKISLDDARGAFAR